MDLSIDQVHALIAIADAGGVLAASKRLNKTHTAVLYQLKQMEAQVGFSLINREQYKATLTPKGKEFLVEARRFILALERLVGKAELIKSEGLGCWKLSYDAIFPIQEIVNVANKLKKDSEISIQLYSDTLNSVENTFWNYDCGFMISLFPSERKDLFTRPLGSLRSFFVSRSSTRKEESLSSSSDKKKLQTLIVVRGVDPQWILTNEGMHWRSKIIVNDFYAKREAILAGLGVGWLPESLIQSDLKKGTLVLRIDPESKSTIKHRDYPIFYSTRLGLEKEILFEKTFQLLSKSQWLSFK